MKLIITEKNIAAKKIAEILADKKPRSQRVSSTPVYRFEWNGEDTAVVGLKGHILETEFADALIYRGNRWYAQWPGGEQPARIPSSLPTPPWDTKRKPFLPDGVELGRSWKITALPYLIWAPLVDDYKEEDIIGALEELAPLADEAIIATDFDREGELIGADARSIILDANPNLSISRARYSAITKGEVQRAFSDLDTVDDNLADAGATRRDIDLIWGAVLTRYLTSVRFAGMGKTRSAGRVQTPTLRLIVDRELERDAFQPEDYWVIKADLATDSGEPFRATHTTERFIGEGAREAAAAAFERAESAKGGAATVTSVEEKERTAPAPMPFNTTALQAAAANEGLSPSRTMRIAESLYMNGLISYPRVDNTVYPPSLDLHEILGELAKVGEYRDYANRLLAKDKLTPTRGKKETTDHPPIHPTGAARQEDLRAEEWKLYNLVARRFMATLSAPAKIRDTTALLEIAGEPFKAKGHVVVTPGFREIYTFQERKDELLPMLAAGDTPSVVDVTIEEKATTPPARYSEASIITAMEKLGLGTKATRHDAIQKLADRKYVAVEDRSIRPMALGKAVIGALAEHADAITTPDMTKDLESEMDEIANGRKDRADVTDHSRTMLASVLELLIANQEQIGDALGDSRYDDIVTVGVCPKCSKDLQLKESARTGGRFIGCSGWTSDGAGCDVTYPLPATGKIEFLPETCETCNSPRVKYTAFRAKPVDRCVNPHCETNHEEPVDLGACPTCAAKGIDGRVMTIRSKTSLKRFARCLNYEECKTSYPLPQRGEFVTVTEPCDACGSPQISSTSARGEWTRCINMECPKQEEKKAAGAGKPRRGGTKKPAGSRRSKSTGTRTTKGRTQRGE